MPTDDGWNQSGHSQGHRGAPYVGGGGPGGPPGAAGMAPGRLLEMADVFKQEIEGLLHDNSALRSQREEFEAKAAAQIAELTSIKNIVAELETNYHKARQGYEEELQKLRLENQSLRTAAAQANNSISNVDRSAGPSYQNDYNRDDRNIKRPKPIKESDRHEVMPPRTPQPEIRPDSPYEFPGSLSPSALPANLRNNGSDWFAMHNPRVPQRQLLDVKLKHEFNHASVVCCVRFSKDGKYLATGCNRTAQIYDVSSGERVCELIDDKASMEGDLYIRSVCFSPDGKYLATGAEDRQIRIWEISKKRIRHLFEGHEQEIYSLDFSSTGNLIVSGSGDRTARIWNLDTGSELKLSIMDTNSPDGDAAMGESGVAGDAGVTSVAISPDDRLVAAGSLDTIVRLWDVRTGKLIDRLRGHRDSVYSVAFTPDGRGLVSGSLDKTLKYWELNTDALRAFVDGVPRPNETYARCIHNFIGHKDYVLSVAISHDGQWIVSGSKDRGVQFWDTTGNAHMMLQGHKNSVISIDLSPTGGLLATGSGDWQARVWSYSTV